MHWYDGDWSGWGAAFMWLGMIAVWGLAVLAALALPSSASHRDDGALIDEARRILDAMSAREPTTRERVAS